MKEGDGTLLDHVMIVYGSGISDGDRHNHDDLPILLAGKGGGTITPAGTSSMTPCRSTTSTSSMLDRMGVEVDRHGTARGGWGCSRR